MEQSKSRTEMTLESICMRWLWLDKNCHYVLRERTPRYACGEPDVIGVTKDRFLIEIEIKRSMSDFNADFKKHHRINRPFYLEDHPKFFYYAAEKSLSERMLPKIPEWAGLLSVEDWGAITVLKSGKANKLSKKLSLKECVKMTRCMVNHMMSLELKIQSCVDGWSQRCSDNWPQQGDFQI